MSRGRIITFYSFKGGVGRSMALANVAVLLARRGRDVLCVDWDLEAAGLHRYFHHQVPEGYRPERGLLDLVGSPDVAWQDLAVPITLPDLPGGGCIDLLPAGTASETYVERLQGFDWSRAYAEGGLGTRLEQIREEWIHTYDVVLLDSRTGLSDIGGICTIQLPDILVMLLGANRQSLDGTLDVARRAEAARGDLPCTRSSLMVLPLPSRFEGRTEVEQAQRWLQTFAEELAPLYTNWLDAQVTPAELLRHTRIPAIPRWSFEEALPVLEEDSKDPDTISYSLEAIAALLDRGLEGTAELVHEREAFVATERVFDFGFVVSNASRSLAAHLARSIREAGRTVCLFDEFVEPGDDFAAAAEEFVARSRVVVGFYAPGGADATPFTEAAEAHGKRFVPILTAAGARLPRGAENLVPIRAWMDQSNVRSRLVALLDRPGPRRPPGPPI